jgi:flagellar assembly factor FliW
MPHVLTRDFGTLAYEPSAELRFPRGLPGFEDQNRFILLARERQAPIVFLQSLTTPGLCFLTVSVWLVDPEYQVGITADDLDALGLDRQPRPGDGTVCLAILSAQDGEPFTANLLAPVIANVQSRVALQAIRTDARYSHCHPLPAPGHSREASSPEAQEPPCL